MNSSKTPTTLLAITVWCITILSCSQPSAVQHTHRYFDIPAFFSYQAERLQNSNVQVEKKLYVDGKEEMIILSASAIHWEKEFLLFSECNLNKPAWLDAYEIEVTNTGSQQKVIYHSVNRKAPVTWMKILHPNEPELTEIEIKIRQSSLMNIQETELWYSPTGYAVRKKISPRFWGKSSLLVVEARFIAQAP
jgi:hypothetical protein